MEKNERIITIAIMAGLFGGLIGGPIASLVDYSASPYNPRIHWFYLFGFNGLFWQVKKREY